MNNKKRDLQEYARKRGLRLIGCSELWDEIDLQVAKRAVDELADTLLQNGDLWGVTFEKRSSVWVKARKR